MNILFTCGFFAVMNYDKAVWLAALIWGIFFMVAGFFVLIKRKDRENGDFVLAAVFEFISCWILYIPNEVLGEGNQGNPALNWIEGILTALLKSINVYNNNGYERAVFEGYEIFSSIYGIVRVLSNLALVLFVGGFILKLVDVPLQRLKLARGKRKYFYIFSSLNEKTMTMAGTLPKDRKCVIVFAGSHTTENCKNGVIYPRISISEIIEKYSKTAAGMEIFLFDIEAENIRELEDVCKTLEKEKAVSKVRIFAKLNDTPPDLFDNYVKKHGLEGKDVTVNFVRTEETFIYSTLLTESVFKDAVEENGQEKVIKALIVGNMDERNTEMLKALLHLCQMPGYRPKITLIEEGSGKSRLKKMMPEVSFDREIDVMGDGIYRIDHVEGIDFESDEFEEKVEEICPDFTFAFVNAGDDLLNVNTALSLKAMASRKGRSIDEYTLLVNVSDKSVFERWNGDICRGLKPVGSLKDTYSYMAVTSSEIERASEAIHTVRNPGKPWNDYLNDEYSRHSVFARTLSYKYKVELLKDRFNLAGRPDEPEWYSEEDLISIWNEMSEEERIWKIYEHMRWNMYTRTLGYRKDSMGLLKEMSEENDRLGYKIKALKKDRENDNSASIRELEEKKRKINKNMKLIRNEARIHNDLVPFDELSWAEKIKDSLALTDKVVECLKNIGVR